MSEASLVQVVDGAVDPKLLARGRKAIDALGDEVSYWKTFWFDLGEPSNVLEALALALRPWVPADLQPAGVEWWVGRMRTSDVPLDFHHDRDLALFDETGRVVHPALSSILYFNRLKGGSLAVTDQRLVKRRGAWVLSPSQPGRMDTVHPARNRFALFDGALFHGVLDRNDEIPRGPLPGAPGPWRVSLVVNWWPKRPRALKTWREGRRYRALAGTVR